MEFIAPWLDVSYEKDVTSDLQRIYSAHSAPLMVGICPRPCEYGY